MKVEKPQPIWRYRSDPPHFLNWDVPVRSFIQMFSPYLGDGIIGHQYDWINIPYKEGYQGTEFDADPFAKPRKNLWDAFVVDTRWGWQTAYVMELDKDKLPNLDDLRGWHFGYHFTLTDAYTGQTEDQIRKSRIIIPSSEAIKFLIGDEPVRVFALDKNGDELPTIFEGPISRRDPQFKNARLI